MFSGIFRWSLVVVVQGTLLVQSSPASVQPIGEEFQVNSYTTGNQTGFDVTRDAAGNFIVVWGSLNQDGGGGGIFAQRYTSDGLPNGGEFQVNTYTTDDQVTPSASINAAGEFVIAWVSENQANPTYTELIHARRYDSSGMPLGTDFQVNTSTVGDQAQPDVALSDTGEFMVTWSTFYYFATSKARLFASNGSPQGAEMELWYDGFSPAVDVDASSNFTVVWSDLYGQMEVQRFDSTGSLLLDQNLGAGGAPDVANSADGGFVVTYFGYPSSDVYLKRFDSTGTALGNNIQVNTYTTGSQSSSRIAMDAFGSIIVTWQSGHDGSGRGVYGQRFGSDGSPWGGEFRVNATTAGSQQYPAVATDPGGAFIIVWESDGQDGDGTGGRAQRFAAISSLFYDGFESGNVSSWSTSVP